MNSKKSIWKNLAVMDLFSPLLWYNCPLIIKVVIDNNVKNFYNIYFTLYLNCFFCTVERCQDKGECYFWKPTGCQNCFSAS